MNTVKKCLLHTFEFPDHEILTGVGMAILTSAAYRLIEFKQNRITAFTYDREVIVSTDFSEQRIEESGKMGIVFNARISEAGIVFETSFVVHRIPELPRGFGTGWEFSAHRCTFLEENVKKFVLN